MLRGMFSFIGLTTFICATFAPAADSTQPAIADAQTVAVVKTRTFQLKPAIDTLRERAGLTPKTAPAAVQADRALVAHALVSMLDGTSGLRPRAHLRDVQLRDGTEEVLVNGSREDIDATLGVLQSIDPAGYANEPAEADAPAKAVDVLDAGLKKLVSDLWSRQTQLATDEKTMGKNNRRVKQEQAEVAVVRSAVDETRTAVAVALRGMADRQVQKALARQTIRL